MEIRGWLLNPGGGESGKLAGGGDFRGDQGRGLNIFSDPEPRG